MSFSKLPRQARLYILFSIALSFAILCSRLAIEPIYWLDKDHQSTLPVFILLLSLAVLANIFQVQLTVPHGKMSLGNTVTFLTIMLLGQPHNGRAGLIDPILVAMGSGLAGTLIKRTPPTDGKPFRPTWYKVSLSVANLVQSAFIASWIWNNAGGVSLLELRPEGVTVMPLIALVAVAGSYFFTNTLGISFAVALSQGLNAIKVWRENFLWTCPGYLYAMSAAAGSAILYHKVKYGAFLLLPPVYVVYYSYKLYLDKINAELRHVQELNDLNVRVIGTLAMTIEAKDRYTHKHVERVREYAMAIAQELVVTGDELNAVRIGSMVHDIGKIAVPEAILTKPGKLTSEEFDRMKTHVLVGVKILEAVNFPFPVTDAVLAHHERWDGNGYPNGLKGDEIPLVGRIVALADGFDALTSDRHYRKGMNDSEALELINSQKDKHYDSRVVEALIRTLPRVKPVIEELNEQEYSQDRLEGHRRLIPQEALEEIAHAAEEAVVLAELSLKPNMSQSPEDVIDLLLDKAKILLPSTLGAVFLLDDQSQEVRVKGRLGLYTHLLEGLSMKVGEGVTGWVVAHGQAALNEPAANDLARRVEPGQNLELNSTLAVPLQVGEKCIGAITLYHTGYNLYNAHHLRLLTTLAEHASSALDALFQLQTNQVLAYTDSLTGLPNMRCLIQHLEECTLEQADPFSVLLLDLNGFKQINDTQGHLEGDRVLRDVSEILRESTRTEDLVGRYAGDEFVIICHGRGSDEAARVADRIRQGFAEYRLGTDGREGLSTSIGIATFPIDGTDWRSLLGAADRRMYGNKLDYYEALPPLETSDPRRRTHTAVA